MLLLVIELVLGVRRMQVVANKNVLVILVAILFVAWEATFQAEAAVAAVLAEADAVLEAMAVAV
jgi:hypothetical protein